MSEFRAFQIAKSDAGLSRSVVTRNTSELEDNEVLIAVSYSSLNYKDALSATGNPGVTRDFPHTPGIDAAGRVLESTAPHLTAGDEVIVIGFDLGMETDGGFAERIRVPAGWVTPLPNGLSLRESMILGTAGFTAALCVDKLENAGMTPDGGPVLVTGATGGVGSVAVKILSLLGYETHAVTGKASEHDFLAELGASTIHPRTEFAEANPRPLLRETWGGVVDTVGGEILVNALKALKYGQSLAACGLVNSPNIPTTVFPFILRHVNLLGIDSVELPLVEKTRVWAKLATDWQLSDLEDLATEISLDRLSDAIDRILAGKMVGRGLVVPN